MAFISATLLTSLLKTGKIFGGALYKLFLAKPKAALDALRVGMKVKNRYDVAKAKLASQSKEEQTANEQRKRSDKQAEQDIVRAMDVSRLTSEAKRINILKNRNYDVGKSKFTNSMSDINRVYPNVKLNSDASKLAAASVPMTSLPRNTVENTVSQDSVSRVAGSVNLIQSIDGGTPESKPITELGSILAQQNVELARENYENSAKLGEMIKKSTEISTVNTQAIINLENNKNEIDQIKNVVISETATEVANLGSLIPNSLNNTATHLTDATASMIQNSTDLEKDAIITVGDELTNKINTLGEASASANALIIRNDNKGTDEILGAVSDSNMVVEGKLQSMMQYQQRSDKKWSDVLKIGKEALRDWVKEQLTMVFTIILGLRDMFYALIPKVPLFQAIAAKLNINTANFINPAKEKNKQEEMNLISSRHKLNMSAAVLGEESGENKLKRDEINRKLSDMNSSHAMFLFNELSDNFKHKKINNKNSKEAYNAVINSTWWDNKKLILENVVLLNGIEYSTEKINKLYRFAKDTILHRSKTSELRSDSGLSEDTVNGFFSNKDLHGVKEKIVDQEFNINVYKTDRDYLIDVMRLYYSTEKCVANKSDYYSIPLNDYFLADFTRYINDFKDFDALHINETYNTYYFRDLDIKTLADALTSLRFNDKRKLLKYMETLINRTPEEMCGILIEIRDNIDIYFPEEMFKKANKDVNSKLSRVVESNGSYKTLYTSIAKNDKELMQAVKDHYGDSINDSNLNDILHKAAANYILAANNRERPITVAKNEIRDRLWSFDPNRDTGYDIYDIINKIDPELALDAFNVEEVAPYTYQVTRNFEKDDDTYKYIENRLGPDIAKYLLKLNYKKLGLRDILYYGDTEKDASYFLDSKDEKKLVELYNSNKDVTHENISKYEQLSPEYKALGILKSTYDSLKNMTPMDRSIKENLDKHFEELMKNKPDENTLLQILDILNDLRVNSSSPIMIERVSEFVNLGETDK